MKQLLYNCIIIAFILSIYSCNGPADENTRNGNIKIESQTFKTGDGWGYSIFIDDKLFIRQSIIPVIEGNRAFASEEDAKKVAALQVNKMMHHVKPFLTIEELQQLGLQLNNTPQGIGKR